jgi:hypothetical protein
MKRLPLIVLSIIFSLLMSAPVQAGGPFGGGSTLGVGIGLGVSGGNLNLIAPTTSVLGGVVSLVCSAGQAITGIGTDGSITCGSVGAGFTTPTTGSSFGNVTASGSLTGTNVTAVGINAGAADTSGSNNTLYGFDAGTALTTGAENVAIGSNALLGATSSANDNIAIGYNALQHTAPGIDNVAIGHEALKHSNASNYNIAIGSTAGSANTGGPIVAIGYGALAAEAAGNSGGNVAIGHQSFNQLSGAARSNNTGVGYGTGNSNTAATGVNDDSFFGANAGVSGGQWSFCGAFGSGAVCTANHQIAIGTSSETVSIPGSITPKTGSAYSNAPEMTLSGTVSGLSLSSAVWIASGKTTRALTVENLEAGASVFSVCSPNPTITLYDCVADATCATSPVSAGTVTITAANTTADGTSLGTIPAGHYWLLKITAGTCTSVSLWANAQVAMQ